VRSGDEATEEKPEPKQQPPAGPAPTDAVAVRFKIKGVDYGLLMGRKRLVGKFQELLKSKIAEAAGGLIAPGMVDLALSPGSVVVAATVPADGLPLGAAEALAKGCSGGDFPKALAEALTRLDGVLFAKISIVNISAGMEDGAQKDEQARANDVGKQAPLGYVGQPAEARRGSEPRAATAEEPAKSTEVTFAAGLQPERQGGTFKRRPTAFAGPRTGSAPGSRRPSGRGADAAGTALPAVPAGARAGVMSRNASAPGSLALVGEDADSLAAKAIQAELGKLREELELEIAERGRTEDRVKDLERQLRIARAAAKRKPSPRPKRFGVASLAPYAKEQELPPKVPSPKNSKGVWLPALRALPPQPAKEDRLAAQAEAAAARQACLSVDSQTLSRKSRSTSRLDAISKLESEGMSTWHVRRAEKVARLQELDAFSTGMWDSFFDWQASAESP